MVNKVIQKHVPNMTFNVFCGTLNIAQSIRI